MDPNSNILILFIHNIKLPSQTFVQKEPGRECSAKTTAYVAIHVSKALYKEIDCRTFEFYVLKGPVHNLHKTPSAVLSQPNYFCRQI